MASKRSERSDRSQRGSGTSGVKRTPRAVLILSAYPRRAAAERAARALVRRRILACATVAAGARAFYRWGGRDRAEPSVLLWGKTSAARAAAAIRAIRATHPDRVPEILVFAVQGGEATYLRWLAAAVEEAP